jgi:predicted dehydrogenase
LIGCGAIAQGYGEIFKKKKNVDLALAVDLNQSAARVAAEKFGFRRISSNYREAFEFADAAVVCVPNFLHSSIAADLLSNGISVLCEKPMATSAKDAERMMEAARKTGATMCISNVRRFYWASREAKRLLESGVFGEITSVKVEEGGVFSWPTRSGFFFNRQQAGGGVLMDIGSHVLDLLLWWFGNMPEIESYADDNHGGVEAEVELRMRLKHGALIEVRLSRLGNLGNVYDIQLERGAIAIRPGEYSSIVVTDSGGKQHRMSAARAKGFSGYFEDMVDDFLACVRLGKAPFVNARDVANSIRLIEDCYKNATRISHPWL